MAKIALVTYQKLPDLTPADQLLAAALAELNITPVPALWDDPTCDWAAFDAIIIRSCWDYHLRYGEFLTWLDRLERDGARVWNSARTLRWNSDKRYLAQLESAGIALPETLHLRAGGAADLRQQLAECGWERAVLKPSVSAGAHETMLVGLAQADDDQRRLDGLLATSDVLLQEFLPEVAEGEWSLMFFDGTYCHAVLKRPAEGDFRVQSHFGGGHAAAQADPALIEQARTIVELTERLLDERLLYVRVDGVVRDGQLLLMELELVEPALFLNLGAGAPQQLAAAIAGRLRIQG